jgi:hypothetical protein
MTTMAAPVIAEDSSLARKSATFAIRRAGSTVRIACSASTAARGLGAIDSKDAAIGVSTTPGQMQFERMPFARTDRDRARD